MNLTARKQESTVARFKELAGLPEIVTREQMAALFDRAFEAGVHAESDRVFHARQAAIDKYRTQRLPVAVMDVEPGKIIEIIQEL